MKHFFIPIVALSFLCFQSSTQKENAPFVFDNEELLSKEQEDKFNRLFLAHKKKTGNEIAIHTTASIGNKKDFFSYCLDYANEHGIGKAGRDNGVLIVVSRNLRQVRINTGYGTEKVLKDKIAQKIIDSLMVPQFREQKYYEGIRDGSKEIIRFLELPQNQIK
ncbi:MAG: TPM domain-containing protein [Cytophagaceae bacterium]